MNVTGAADGDFDVTIKNLERVREGFVRIGAFQTNNFGLNGQINLASITLDCDSDDFGSLSMTVNTLKDATPQSNPISYTIDGCTIRVSSSTPPPIPGMWVVIQGIYQHQHRHQQRLKRYHPNHG